MQMQEQGESRISYSRIDSEMFWYYKNSKAKTIDDFGLVSCN